jgi:hypothetical protein
MDAGQAGAGLECAARVSLGVGEVADSEVREGAEAREREYGGKRAEPAGVGQCFVESGRRFFVVLGEDKCDAGVVEERGSVDSLGQQLWRSLERAEREARDCVRGLVRHRGRGRQWGEDARRYIGLVLGQCASVGDPRCGVTRGVCIDLRRADFGALERERPCRSLLLTRVRVRSNTSSDSRMRPSIWRIRPSARVIET